MGLIFADYTFIFLYMLIAGIDICLPFFSTGTGNVGFKPITITADDKNETTIQMEHDGTTLGEVVI